MYTDEFHDLHNDYPISDKNPLLDEKINITKNVAQISIRSHRR